MSYQLDREVRLMGQAVHWTLTQLFAYGDIRDIEAAHLAAVEEDRRVAAVVLHTDLYEYARNKRRVHYWLMPYADIARWNPVVIDQIQKPALGDQPYNLRSECFVVHCFLAPRAHWFLHRIKVGVQASVPNLMARCCLACHQDAPAGRSPLCCPDCSETVYCSEACRAAHRATHAPICAAVKTRLLEGYGEALRQAPVLEAVTPPMGGTKAQ